MIEELFVDILKLDDTPAQLIFVELTLSLVRE